MTEMANFGDISRKLIKRYLSESRYEDIRQKFGLDSADQELLFALLSRLRLDSRIDDIALVCADYSELPNLSRVMQAWEVIAREIAQNSELLRKLNRDSQGASDS